VTIAEYLDAIKEYLLTSPVRPTSAPSISALSSVRPFARILICCCLAAVLTGCRLAQDFPLDLLDQE